MRFAYNSNGLGILPEHRGAIFQRSYRAHADLDDELGNDGFGMGLTIVQECLRELNHAQRRASYLTAKMDVQDLAGSRHHQARRGGGRTDLTHCRE